MKTFDNIKDLNDYLKTEVKEGEEVCLDERATFHHPKRKHYFKKQKEKKSEGEEVKEGIRIERERILKLLTKFPVGEIIMKYNTDDLRDFSDMINKIFERIKEEIEK